MKICHLIKFTIFKISLKRTKQSIDYTPKTTSYYCSHFYNSNNKEKSVSNAVITRDCAAVYREHMLTFIT